MLHQDSSLAVVGRDGAKAYVVESPEYAAKDRPEIAIETDDIDEIYCVTEHYERRKFRPDECPRTVLDDRVPSQRTLLIEFFAVSCFVFMMLLSVVNVRCCRCRLFCISMLACASAPDARMRSRALTVAAISLRRRA